MNILYGINDHLYDPAQHHLLTAASSTTNCLAPVVKVMHEKIGILRGWLSAARIFLLGARDVWFVVGLPVFLSGALGWSLTQVGGFVLAADALSIKLPEVSRAAAKTASSGV